MINTMNDIRAELEKCISTQQFEKAAHLRMVLDSLASINNNKVPSVIADVDNLQKELNTTREIASIATGFITQIAETARNHSADNGNILNITTNWYRCLEKQSPEPKLNKNAKLRLELVFDFIDSLSLLITVFKNSCKTSDQRWAIEQATKLYKQATKDN